MRIAHLMQISFRNGFYAGLLLALIIGIWLFQLWQPARQVQLHSEHFISAVEGKNWDALAAFIDETYQDQWKQDRALVRSRMREVLRFARNLRVQADSPLVAANDRDGDWSARITIAADPNEVAEMIEARVNALDTPFELHWQRKSWKPWDWKLVRVSNSALELPEGGY